MTSRRKMLIDPSLRNERRVLQNYAARHSEMLPPSLAETLSAKKAAAVADGDQSLAKAIWCLEEISKGQDLFIGAVSDMRAGRFEGAWNKLEQCDITLYHLRPHFAEFNDRFGIRHMTLHIRQFQELYPYTLGISPGFIIRESECSICNTKLYLRSTCEHVIGEIYDGEICMKVITKVEMIEVSLVDNPSQKYSVIFPSGDDDPRLMHVKHIAEVLESPWAAWTYARETRKRHFGSDERISSTDMCPCGSGEIFGRCECPKELTFPHFEITVGDETNFDPWNRREGTESSVSMRFGVDC